MEERNEKYRKYEEALDKLNSTIEMLESKCEQFGIELEKVIDVVTMRRLEIDVAIGNTRKIAQVEQKIRRKFLEKKWDLKTLIKFDKNDDLPYEY